MKLKEVANDGDTLVHLARRRAKEGRTTPEIQASFDRFLTQYGYDHARFVEAAERGRAVGRGGAHRGLTRHSQRLQLTTSGASEEARAPAWSRRGGLSCRVPIQSREIIVKRDRTRAYHGCMSDPSKEPPDDGTSPAPTFGGGFGSAPFGAVTFGGATTSHVPLVQVATASVYAGAGASGGRHYSTSRLADARYRRGPLRTFGT